MPSVLPPQKTTAQFKGLTSCTTPEEQLPKQPKVLFILVDDLGLMDLGYTGSTYYETPNVDDLAARSLIFEQGYAASRVCSPSRASIFTGQFTARHGITDWIGAAAGENWRKANRHDKLLPPEYVRQLPHNDVSLAEALKENGYKTFFAGKWHLGSDGSHPLDHGFDINKGGWDVGSPIGGYYAPWKNPNLESGPDGENLSLRLAQETADFIKAHKDTSFFAVLSFYAVHGPIQTTKEKWAKYQAKSTNQGYPETGFVMERNLPIRTVQDNPVYAGLVETMDDAVGIALNALKEAGIDQETIVVFTSDNGGVASGDAYSTSNLPLRGGKGYQWEGGIREPYLISVPWQELANTTTNYPATGADFYPTILDLLGLDLKPEQHIDGASLAPLFQGETLPERPLYWHYPHYGNQGGNPSSILRQGSWKLIHYWETESSELYNLEEDPGEQNDVAEANPELAQQMTTQLLDWLQSVDANLAQKDTRYNAELRAEFKQKVVNEWWPFREKQRLDFLDPNFDPGNAWWGSGE
ncbi:MAG: sulfatase [Bacteroidota bacterium]